MISVIIPTYNRANFILSAINSVLNQTYKDYEIIIIDDGSTDSTKEMLEQYKNAIVYIYQENSGVSAARNAGIKLAKGDWIAFLDSDDEWHDDYLSTQIMHIEQYKDSVAFIANSNTIKFDGSIDNHFKGIKILNLFKNRTCIHIKRPISFVVERGYWFLQSTIIRKDVLIDAGLFDETISIAEDLDLISRVAQRGSITFCKEEKVKIIRRIEEIENLTAKSRRLLKIRIDSYIKVYGNLLRLQNLSIQEKRTISKILSFHLRALGNALMMEGNNDEAFIQYRAAIRLYPSVRTYIKLMLSGMPVRITKSLKKNV